MDLLLSISCLILMITILTPFIINVGELQEDLDSYLIAQEQLNRQLLDHFTPTKPEHHIDYSFGVQNKTFNFKVYPLNHKYFVCITWFNSKDEEERLCRYVPTG
ncbi:hypothetical protein [Tenuibacillus multivorans]|nr:hypothetical protein [Tenuibacillus multivorans]GEL77341.1 hypothetical protein TMU01_15760 [Tenuibacillus multivorans]